MRSFASDNNSGVHPLVMDAVIKANDNHAVGYGDDPWTAAATAKIKEVFGEMASPFFVFMLSPLDETSHLPTGSGKEYSFSLSEEKSTVKDLDFEKSPGVEMFICCFSAGEKS